MQRLGEIKYFYTNILLSKDSNGLVICLGCRQIYELIFPKDAHILTKDQTNKPGTYCYPCSYRIIVRGD